MQLSLQKVRHLAEKQNQKESKARDSRTEG
jgi:hypothetical protein